MTDRALALLAASCVSLAVAVGILTAPEPPAVHPSNLVCEIVPLGRGRALACTNPVTHKSTIHPYERKQP